MQTKDWLGPGFCVFIALIMLLGSVVMPVQGHNSAVISDRSLRTCADAGGHWGFQKDVGIGCFAPDGRLIAFVDG